MKKILEELGLKENQVKTILYNRNKPKPKILKRFISDKDLDFAIVSDTHFGSQYEKLDELHTFYQICKKEKIHTVFHCGDIVDGNGKIYRGQLNEIHTYGATHQANYVIDYYPKIKGITTFFILGNHCLSFFNENGIDIGSIIDKERDDMVYLGQYDAYMEMNKVRFRLIHPDGGGAYALSYKGQKFAEQIASGNKPDILIFGHYHTSFYFWYRNIHIFNAGTFMGQNSYLVRKGLNPAIGGWICKMKLGKKDRVVALESCWIPFFSKSIRGHP